MQHTYIFVHRRDRTPESIVCITARENALARMWLTAEGVSRYKANHRSDYVIHGAFMAASPKTRVMETIE